jgi:hypothetical protein
VADAATTTPATRGATIAATGTLLLGGESAPLLVAVVAVMTFVCQGAESVDVVSIQGRLAHGDGQGRHMRYWQHRAEKGPIMCAAGALTVRVLMVLMARGGRHDYGCGGHADGGPYGSGGGQNVEEGLVVGDQDLHDRLDGSQQHGAAEQQGVEALGACVARAGARCKLTVLLV